MIRARPEERPLLEDVIADEYSVLGAHVAPELDPLLSARDVRELVGNISSSTLWRWVREDGFPPPIRLGANRIAWRQSDLAEWIKTRPRAERPRRSGT